MVKSLRTYYDFRYTQQTSMPTLEAFKGYISDGCVTTLHSQHYTSWQAVYNATFKAGLQLRTCYGQNERSTIVLRRLFEWIIVHK